MDATVVLPALAALLHLPLHHLEGVRVNDSLVVVLHIVLRDFALIDLLFLRQVIDGVGLLQESTAFVFLVRQDAFDRRGVPLGLASGRQDAVIRELLSDAIVRHALKEHGVDALNNGRLLPVDHQIAVRPTVVAEESVERNRDLAVCKALPLAPGAVFRYAPAFLLRQRGHDGQEQFALPVERPDILFFKIALDAVFLELADGGQAVHRVPGKTADALGHDEVDFPVQRIRDHAFEALAVLGAGARDACVRIDIDELPIVPALDVIRVVINLGLVAGELVVVVSGNTRITGDPALFLLRDRRSCETGQRGRDGGNLLSRFRHGVPSISLS